MINLSIIDGKFDISTLSEAIMNLNSRAMSLEIDNGHTLSEGATIVRHANELVKKIESARKSYTSKLDSAKKAIMQQEKSLVKPLNDAIETIRANTEKYLAEKRKEELALRERAIEDASRLEKIIAKIADLQAMKDIRKLTKSEEEALNLAQIEYDNALNSFGDKSVLVDGSENVGTRITWDYEVVAEELLPRDMLSVDKDKVKALLKKWKDEGRTIESIAVEGLKIFEKITAVFR